MSNDLKSIANRIKQTMLDLGLKQVDLVKTTGASKGSVSKWISGKACPNGEYLLRLSQVLKEPEYWILNGEYPYSSYADADDAQDYINSIEESRRELYIKELELEPDLPYSIKYLGDLYDEYQTNGYLESKRKYEELFELTAAQEKELEDWEEQSKASELTLDQEKELAAWQEQSLSTAPNKEQNLSHESLASINKDFAGIEVRSLKTTADIAGANYDETVYYILEDDSMAPIISYKAQCCVDISKTEVRNGKCYLLKHDLIYRVRFVFIQPDGSLLLRSENRRFEDEILYPKKSKKFEIIGWIYSWINIDSW